MLDFECDRIARTNSVFNSTKLEGFPLIDDRFRLSLSCRITKNGDLP